MSEKRGRNIEKCAWRRATGVLEDYNGPRMPGTRVQVWWERKVGVSEDFAGRRAMCCGRRSCLCS